jgi:hypothetical protein
MPLTVRVNTIAECLRADCNILGDNNNNNNKKNLSNKSHPESNTPISVDNISGLAQHEQNVRSKCLHHFIKSKQEDMNEWYWCQGIQNLHGRPIPPYDRTPA